MKEPARGGFPTTPPDGPRISLLGGPIISVVLPVRDGEATLGAALGSLHAQTFQRFEVIVVDDGSGDGTAAIARAWAKRDGRFRVVRGREGGAAPDTAVARTAAGAVGPQRRPGPARGPGSRAGGGAARRTAPNRIVAALQRGLAEACGRYVARMDADDLCHPERLAAQLDLLERSPDLAGCGTGVRYFPESGVTPRAAEYAAWLNSMTHWDKVAANIFVECPLAHPTFMFRASALAEVGGYRDHGWPEDYDLLLRLWRRGRRFVSVPRVLLDWRDDPGRLSRNHDAYSLAAFRACRVHHLRKSLLRGRSGVVVWGAGPTGKRLAREFVRQGAEVLAFVEVDPRKIGQRIHGAPVVGVDAVRDGRWIAEAEPGWGRRARGGPRGWGPRRGGRDHRGAPCGGRRAGVGPGRGPGGGGGGGADRRGGFRGDGVSLRGRVPPRFQPIESPPESGYL